MNPPKKRIGWCTGGCPSFSKHVVPPIAKIRHPSMTKWRLISEPSRPAQRSLQPFPQTLYSFRYIALHYLLSSIKQGNDHHKSHSSTDLWENFKAACEKSQMKFKQSKFSCFMCDGRRSSAGSAAMPGYVQLQLPLEAPGIEFMKYNQVMDCLEKWRKPNFLGLVYFFLLEAEIIMQREPDCKKLQEFLELLLHHGILRLSACSRAESVI